MTQQNRGKDQGGPNRGGQGDKDRDYNRGGTDPNRPGQTDPNRPGQTDPNRPGQTDPNRPGQGGGMDRTGGTGGQGDYGHGGTDRPGVKRPGEKAEEDDMDEEPRRDTRQNRDDETAGSE